MEDILNIQVPAGKVYSANAASLATFFGGPLAGAYIIGHNYKIFGQRRKMVITWAVAALLLVLTLGITLFVPALDKIPNMAYSLIFILLARQVVQVDQKKEIAQHSENGGTQYTAWNAVLIGIAGGLLLLACIFGALYLVPELMPERLR